MTIVNQFFDRLEGVWQNKLADWLDDLGWNFISQPKLNHPGGSDFEMRFDQMREKIEFKKLGGQARNIGITGEAGFWQAMSYEISISTPADAAIHHEMGHFLLSVLESGQTHGAVRGEVIRQATIPRANAMMTTGELTQGNIAQAVEIYDAKPQANGPTLQGQIDTEFAAKQTAIGGLGGPDFQQPLTWLQTKPAAANPVGNDWVFAFRNDTNPSQMAHGQRVVNPVAIGNLLSDFWIGERVIGGTDMDVLQYAQKVNLIFHGIEWPHVAVNTLIKQP